jgi:protein ImuB
MDEVRVMYAVLHPPNFFAQAAALEKPELRKRPFVVLDGEAPEEFVFAANKLARQLGVELGMSRLQVESCDVAAIRRDVDCEEATVAKLHEVVCRFSPRLELVAERPGTYALDIRGMNTMYGDPTILAAKMRQSAMAVGLLANVAVAENFHAAACLSWGRLGVTVVPVGGEADALGPLPLSVLPIEPEHAERFETWGVRTCRDLATLAETDLIARLGQAGKRLHALARGTWPHLLAPMEASFESGLVESMELDFPVEALQQLLFLLSRMTTDMLRRVQEKARAIASIRVLLTLDNRTQHERMVRPALPLQDTKTLLKLIQLDLELHPPGAAIVAVELRAQSAAPYRAQHGLFLPQAPEPGQTEVLIARLRKLLGEGRVGSPELTDDHRPNAFHMVPFQPPPPRRSEQLTMSVPIALRVCRPPQVITVQLVDERPIRLRWDAVVYEITEAAAPVQVSGQWWSEANWCREEWDVRLASNAAECVCRIAYDPRSRCWYMQGVYD